MVIIVEKQHLNISVEKFSKMIDHNIYFINICKKIFQLTMDKSFTTQNLIGLKYRVLLI